MSHWDQVLAWLKVAYYFGILSYILWCGWKHWKKRTKDQWIIYWVAVFAMVTLLVGLILVGEFDGILIREG